MKRTICLFLTLILLLSLAACADDSKTYTTEISSPESGSNASDTVKDTAAASKSGDIDVDLTSMSSTMVYSEVLNMQQTPDSYLGKTVKMNGAFNVTEIDGNRYFACVIADATACCSTGIEFVLAGDHSYPDDYPEQDTEITVVGTFNTYMEGQNKYLQLKDAEMQF